MFRKTLLACAIGLGCSQLANANNTESAPVEVDQETMKSLGVDPEISRYFSQEAKFLPGRHSVSLRLNGEDAGSVVASFDDSGNLCFDKSFMEQAGVKVPSDYHQGCYDFVKANPDAIITLAPVQERIELVVRQELLAQQSRSIGDFNSGGSAGLLNYSLLSSRNEYVGGRSDYSQLMLSGGFNVSDWLFRTHQLVSRTNGTVNSENSQNYLQHTFINAKTTMKAGEVSLNNRLLEGSNIYGVELVPESALAREDTPVQVTGIANTPQARVEIRQQGIVVFSTLVAVGPFTLTDIPLRNYTSDLNVTVIETDGSQRTFVVPSSIYNRSPGAPAGYAISFGRVSDDYSKTPWVASISGGKRLNTANVANVGTIISDGYQAVGVSLDSGILPQTMLSAQVNQAWDGQNARQGQKYQLQASFAAKMGFSLSASVTKNSEHYRELSQALNDDELSANKYEYSLGASWGAPVLGAFSTSIYETQPYGGGGRSRYATLNWGKTFKTFSVTTSWQRQLSGGSENTDNEDIVYINISVPLGQHQLNAYSRQKKDASRYGLSTTGRLTEDTTYSLGTERDSRDSENSFSAGTYSNLHYTQLSLNAGMNGSQSRNYSGSLQGGVSVHSGGVTLSPLTIRDTFAIAQLDKPVAGVKLDTPQGPVWTDFRGQAVIPSVNAWQASRVELRTETLPKNMDIGNGTRVLKQARGAVGKVQFGTLTQRRVLMTAKMPDGKPLPKGVAITDAAGNYLTTSVDDGVLFLNDVANDQRFTAQLESGSCTLALSLPDEAPKDTFYETVSGICK